MEVQEKSELIEKAKVFTSSAFLMVEAANSYMVDVVSTLEKLEMGMKHGELKQFKILHTEAIRLKERTERITAPLYEHKAKEAIMIDSDFIYDFLKLLIDRTGGVPENMTKARALIFNMKSELNSY